MMSVKDMNVRAVRAETAHHPGRVVVRLCREDHVLQRHRLRGGVAEYSRRASSSKDDSLYVMMRVEVFRAGPLWKTSRLSRYRVTRTECGCRGRVFVFRACGSEGSGMDCD